VSFSEQSGAKQNCSLNDTKCHLVNKLVNNQRCYSVLGGSYSVLGGLYSVLGGLFSVLGGSYSVLGGSKGLIVLTRLIRDTMVVYARVG